MKNFLFILASVCLAFPLAGQNRLATEYDRKLYGDYIQVGDLIIDSPTKFARGQYDLVYYFMPRQWPNLRDGATIWLDGDKLGVLNEIKFCNTSQPLKPWHIETITIRNIPHTRIVANSFVCQGIRNFTLDGESAAFPGLSYWPESRTFLSGAFGFHMIGNLQGGHAFTVNVLDGGTIRMNGFEAQHGFSGVRINGGNYDMTVESIEISNFYIHDTGNGEGQYLGATHKPPLAKLKNLKIHHGVITRTAAEALQLQHLVGGSDIHHITIFAADVRWMNEFASGQDTGIQWSVDAGENALHHVIVDGYASMGLVPFGSPLVPKGGVSKVHHVLFHDGRDTGIYLHKSASFGVHWMFDNLYFAGIRDTYYEQTGRNARDFYVSRKHGTDRITFTNIFHDGSKPKVFQDTTGIEFATLVKKDLPEPQYRNNGFPEPAHRIKHWQPLYGSYFPVSKRDSVRVEVPTQWKEGDIAIETLGRYAFFKCLKSHLAGKTRPAENPDFMPLTWDANGVRCDQPSWDRNSKQSLFPPDDLRLQKNNYWKKLGFGFQEELLTAKNGSH